MHNLKIEVKKTVTCDFSADQWGLLTNSFPRAEIEGIANRLNTRLEEFIDNEYSWQETLSGMHDHMQYYSNYGAYDTEPRTFLATVLAEIYK